jgi:hypothetical protein
MPKERYDAEDRNYDWVLVGPISAVPSNWSRWENEAPRWILPITTVWFVFFPPAFYCRWVEGSGSARTEGSPAAN